ncbi:MAG: isocitrate lyase/PEP mutase family protein [Candidatus Yanofskybacteria bacterium]|nr:isocitrate lyase/PEP mutase family protein [Candidatus Yanofskybacteria bacterium]
MDKAGDLFGKLVARPQGLFAYGVYDAMSAKMAELAGHEAIYIGGYAAAGGRMLPDMGILTMTEMINHIKFIAEAASVPLMVDIDDGYGNVNNVIRTVSELLALLSIGAFHIEDQRYPKRCGHIKGKEVLPLDEFLGKLKAAIDTRDKINPYCKVIARTDAFSAAGGKKSERFGGDVDEAIKRLTAYADAGADYLWCEFPNPDPFSAEVVATSVRKVHPNISLAFNISPSFSREDWNNSSLTERILNEMGYKLRFATYPALLEAMKVVFESALKFRQEATNGLRSLKERVAGTPAESVMKAVNVEWYLANERKYDPSGTKKQSTSEGFGSTK